MTDEQIFSREYGVSDDSTPFSPDSEAEVEIEEQIDREVKQYGVGKPVRITQRAQIIND